MGEAAFDFYRGIKPTAPEAAKRNTDELLSPLLLELESVIGLDATLKLVDRWGGGRLYIPEVMTEHHAIAEHIGMNLAKKMSSYYGLELLDIPLARSYFRARRNREIYTRYKSGESASRLAKHYGLGLRQTWEILAGERAAIEKEKYRKLMKGRK